MEIINSFCSLINEICTFLSDKWEILLGPIIAVLIAVWTIKKSAKETEKKLAALEESTNKQVDKLTQLMKLQTEITSIHLGKELWETHFRLHELTGQKGNALEDNRNIRSNLNKVELEGMTEEEKACYHKEKFYDEQL